MRLIVCINQREVTAQASCGGRGSVEIAAALKQQIKERQLDLEVETTPCLGHCERGPTVRLLGGQFFLGASVESVGDILDKIERLAEK